MTPSVRTLQGSKTKGFQGSTPLCPRGSNTRGFSIFKCIIYMPCNYRLVFLEQFCHLLLCQPNSFTFHSHLQPDGLIGLIHDDFAFA